MLKKIKKLFSVLLLVTCFSYGQSQFNDLNIGASFGMLCEMGDVKSDGFNPALDFSISKGLVKNSKFMEFFTLKSRLFFKIFF